MLVKRLHALVGHDINLRPGDHVDVSDKVAKDWKARGLATDPDKGAAAGDNMQALKKALKESEARVKQLEVELAAALSGHADAQKTLV